MTWIVGDMAQISIQAKDEDPALLIPPGGVLFVARESRLRAAKLRNAENLIPLIAALPGVKAVSPQINGSGYVTRGTQAVQISINGVEPRLGSAIINLDSHLVAGTARLAAGSVRLGRTLAGDIDLRLGQTVRMTSTTGNGMVLTLTGIYEIWPGGPDRRTACISLASARTLSAMPQGVTKVAIKLDHINASDIMAQHISALTGLDAKSRTEQVAQLVATCLRSGVPISGIRVSIAAAETAPTPSTERKISYHAQCSPAPHSALRFWHSTRRSGVPQV